MTELLIRPGEEYSDGLLRPIEVTPHSAGWHYISFSVFHLRKGQTITGSATGQESALVLLSGIGEATMNNQPLGSIGERLSVFEEKAPYALYLSHNGSYSLHCTSDSMEVVLASAPASERSYPARLITPQEISIERRGEGNTQRRVQHILDTDQEAERLILVEVYTPAGNWSSFPPHKHDTNNPPHESYLEEIYYHHVQQKDGCALQRLYRPGEFDETVAVRDGELVLVPKGYHMVGALPGCDNYYFNVMAGPSREWLYQVDPAFHRLLPPSGKITGTIVQASS